jgi:hypothetical protein
MAFRLNRRLTALATAMLFSFSVAAHGLTATHASMKVMDAVATNDMQPPPPDHGCGGNDGGGMACFALCASAVAVLPVLITLPMTMAMTQRHSHEELFMASRGSPPDPAPPRSVVLS